MFLLKYFSCELKRYDGTYFAQRMTSGVQRRAFSRAKRKMRQFSSRFCAAHALGKLQLCSRKGIIFQQNKLLSECSYLLGLLS